MKFKCKSRIKNRGILGFRYKNTNNSKGRFVDYRCLSKQMQRRLLSSRCFRGCRKTRRRSRSKLKHKSKRSSNKNRIGVHAALSLLKRPLLLLVLCIMLSTSSARSQTQEVEQLIFNVTKLAQYKQILQDLQTGYQILSQGYNKIKAIAEGNFSLHSLFISGLLKVNPAIAKYKRVADIISDQLMLMRTYKSAYRILGASGMLRPYELDYVAKVYDGLVDKSLDNLESLATIITADKLRMSDAERITAIDQIYQGTHQMLGYLNVFNKDLAALVGGRKEAGKAGRTLSDFLDVRK